MSKNEANTVHVHPITRVINDINKIFFEMGFTLTDGPELETEYYNFDALNVPKDHPARDMQDTFWVKSNKDLPGAEGRLLRTHTSPMQVHFMEENKKLLGTLIFRNVTLILSEMHLPEFKYRSGIKLT